MADKLISELIEDPTPASTSFVAVDNGTSTKKVKLANLPGASGTIVTRETPGGAVDGSNAVFVLAEAPIAGSEQVFLNGILQEEGSGDDYTIVGASITMTNPPESGDRVRVSYRY